MKNLIALVTVVTLLAGASLAQQGAAAPDSSDMAAMQQKIRDLEDRIIALEGQLRTMKTQAEPALAAPTTASTAAAEPATPTAAVPAPPAQSVTSSGETPSYGGNTSAAKALNPDISVIGDFIGAAGGNAAPAI